MSDGAISQDEIDALLAGVTPDGLSATGHVTEGKPSNIDIDALKTFTGNIKDSVLDKINNMTGATFTMGDVGIEVLDRDGLLGKISEVVVCVSSDFNNAITGEHSYILDPAFSQKLVSLVTKEEVTELDDAGLSCVCEVVSLVTGSSIDEIGKSNKFPGVACNPAEAVNNPKAMIRIPQGKFALVTYPLTLEGKTYNLMEVLAGNVAESIGSIYAVTPEPAVNSAASNANMAGLPQQPTMNMQNMQGVPQMQGMQMQGMPQMAPMGQMAMPGMQMQGMQGMMGYPMGMPMAQNMGNIPNVQALQYPNLQNSTGAGEQGNIALIMDVFMEMTVELGRTKKQIKDILGMGEGTIIELDKLAGEPVDILVNHKPIAKGEVVVIDENFGVRVTEILSPMERVSSLK